MAKAYPIDKQYFNRVILDANENPNDKNLQNLAAEQLSKLASMLTNQISPTARNKEDLVQEVVLRSIPKRKVLNRDKGNAFNLFWTIMRNDLLKVLKKQQTWNNRNFLFSNLKYEPQCGMNGEETIDMENYLIEKLDFELNQYKPQEKTEKKPASQDWTVHADGHGTIGEQSFASYLVEAYKFVEQRSAENKAVSENELLKFIPEGKSLGDAANYMKIRLQIIARANGKKFKTYKGQEGKAFLLINQ